MNGSFQQRELGAQASRLLLPGFTRRNPEQERAGAGRLRSQRRWSLISETELFVARNFGRAQRDAGIARVAYVADVIDSRGTLVIAKIDQQIDDGNFDRCRI